MDSSNNWRPAQVVEPNTADSADWRSQLQADSRQRIVNKIMDTLKRHLPISGPEGLLELKKIAMRFEEKIYTAATSQSDYLRKISLKMLTMETKSQNTGVANSLPSNSVVSNQNLQDPASHSIQSQVRNQGQTQISLANQSQGRQVSSQNIQDTTASGGVQSSSSLPSALPSVSGLTSATMPNAIGQSSNLQSISGISQNSVGQGVPSNIFSNQQRQMQGRQHQQQVVSHQNQQQPPNSQQYMYHQSQIVKQKLQQQNIQPSLMQSHIQQQQNLLQATQMQPTQQSLMQMSSGLQSNQSTLQQSQPSMIQSASHSGFQQNQQSSVQQSTSGGLQQNHQSVLRQQPHSQQSLHPQSTGLHQQQTSIPQQQHQTLAGQQQNISNAQQQNQLIGQQNGVTDLQQSQQLQQQQRLLGQQNGLSHMQQQLLGQQNNISSLNQQQLGSQSSVGLQQQQMVGAQSGVSNLQAHQSSLHVLQAKAGGQQQQTAQSSSTMMQIPGQQSQVQVQQQQLIPQLQSQPAQFQQQLGLQHQTNPLQRDMQLRINSSGIQSQNVIDQKQIQSQRLLSEASSTSMDSTSQTGHANTADWQEESFQKIQTMREMYLQDLNEMHQKITQKLQQQDFLTQQPKEQIERLRMMRVFVERVVAFLNVNKANIPPSYKDKMGNYEKQIVTFLNTNRGKKPNPSLQGQQQLQPSGGHTLSMPQQQQPQSQVTQLQQPDNQMNSKTQSMNLPNSLSSSMTGMSHGSLPLSAHIGVPSTQANMMTSMQSGSSLEMGQANAPNSLQQGAIGSRPNTVSGTQQANMNSLSQSGVNGLQPNINSLQLTNNMFQQQHLKQQQEQKLLQSQQLKQQLHQRQMHQQLIQQQQQQQQLQQQHPQLQQQLQQQQQQQKQQQSAQFQAHQSQQLHQMSDDLKLRQGMGFKPGMTPQHHSAGQQRPPYHNQQLKTGAQFPISSPQLITAASPQISQQSSPQIDQQSLLSSLSKTGTPLQSANSPFVVPSPSTPLAPSPLPGDHEKQASGVSALSNAGNIGHPQTTTALTQAQSLAIGTPGISASPLLAEFISADGNQVTEQPLERLMKAVKSISPNAFSAAVTDIGSVISMIDRIAGSAPGNGSRAAVGEDLVAMTKCRMQARNFIAQDGASASKKMRRDTSAMPLNTVSSAGSVNDNIKQLNGLELSDLESTATSRIRRPRVEANHALLEEIKDINQRLIDTVVEISDEDVDPTTVAAAAEGGQGTIVKCSYNAVALGPKLKAQYASAQMSPILPLQLLIPTNYPNCSPVLLDKFPVDVSKDSEDLSLKVWSRFSNSLRSLSQPMSLKELVRTWDVSTRAVISDYAQQNGGGTFSSRYGTWEKCVSAV